MSNLKEIIYQFFRRNKAYSDQYEQFNPRFNQRIKTFFKAKKYKKDTLKNVKLLFFPIENNPVTDLDIYETGNDVKTFVKHQYRIHGTFKHKFFYPLMYLARKILGKYMVTKITDNGKVGQLRNLKVLNAAHEKTLHDIAVTKAQSSADIKIDDVDMKTVEHNLLTAEPYQMLRDMLGLVLTIGKNDTYYLNYIDMMMYNITIFMNKEYKNEIRRGKVGHLLYTNRAVFDVGYFSIKQHSKLILKNLELFKRKAKKDWEKGIGLCERCSTSFEAKVCNKCKGIEKMKELQKEYQEKRGI